MNSIPLRGCCILLLFLIWAPSATAGSFEIWEARYLLAVATAEVERNGDDIRGVVYVKEPLREAYTYHFSGTIRGGRVLASHYEGHSFCGKVTGDGEISGVLTTSTGTRIEMQAARRPTSNQSDFR
jgi:hypothetical protein